MKRPLGNLCGLFRQKHVYRSVTTNEGEEKLIFGRSGTGNMLIYFVMDAKALKNLANRSMLLRTEFADRKLADRRIA